jgi:hypothetical protein
VYFTISATCLCLLAACGGDNKLVACDIRESDCQFDVFLAVQDVRGSIWDLWLEPPPMDVISEAQYRAQLIAERERARQQTGVDYLSEGLKLLRMIDPEETPDQETDFTVETVAAFYDAQRHNVTIIDRGDTDNAVAVGTLAHELVHAAQSRDVGFGRLYQDVASTDNVLALSALLEGEAVMYAYLVDAKQLDIPKTFIDWRILDGWLADVRTATFAAGSPYRVATTQLAYPLGGMYAAAAYAAGGPLELRGVYDRPPLSAARFMAGRGAVSDVAAPAWSCAQIAPPPGFELQLGDELGALALYSFATRFALAETVAWERARTWTGDRFYVYTRPGDDEALAVVWLLRLASAQAAAALRAALIGVAWPQLLQSLVRGEMVHLFATKAPLSEPYEAWQGCDPL